jgi:peptide/nickel transport system permease protein
MMGTANSGVIWRTKERGTRSRHAGLSSAVLLVSVGIITVSIFAAVAGDWIAPHNPYDGDLRQRLLPPSWESGGRIAYVLGTDPLGRDILSRIIVGARVSLSAAVMSIVVGGGVGTAMGILAGWHGKQVDAIVMRTADMMLAFPSIFLALLLAVVLGPSFWNIVAVIALVLWARFARVVRAEVLTLRTREFVALAKISGASNVRIMARHLLPNVLNTVMVMSTLQVGWAILLEASLSFLGAGIPPPIPAWGSMVASGRDYVETAWWLATFPGLAIFLNILAVNLLGDWLRDALDPKLRQVVTLA